jgi:hypothetical protein
MIQVVTTKNDDGSSFSHIWKAKIPLEIKIFTWLMENNAVLTKDNMTKGKLVGTLHACFATRMKQHTTYSSNVLWLNAFGALWLSVFEQIPSHGAFNTMGYGFKKSSPMGKPFTTLAYHL